MDIELTDLLENVHCLTRFHVFNNSASERIEMLASITAGIFVCSRETVDILMLRPTKEKKNTYSLRAYSFWWILFRNES